MGGDKRLIAVFILVLLAVSIIASQFAASKSASKILDLESTIHEKELELNELNADAEGISPVSEGGAINCLLCHELKQTKSFHLPQIIMKIEERSGLRRRLCIDCHGPNSYDGEGNFLGWNADRQMTSASVISFNEDAGVNGVFEFPGSLPHTIHKRLLYSLKIITCDDCHLLNETIVRPKVDAEKGQVLVCQNCKNHPEQGNYIKIHVEDGGNGCPTCHTGGVIEIHRDQTLGLGKIG